MISTRFSTEFSLQSISLNSLLWNLRQLNCSVLSNPNVICPLQTCGQRGPYWLRNHSVACLWHDILKKTLEWGCNVFLDFWLVLSFLFRVPAPPHLYCCRFLRNSSRCHILVSLSSVTQLSLLVGFCAACMQTLFLATKLSLNIYSKL